MLLVELRDIKLKSLNLKNNFLKHEIVYFINKNSYLIFLVSLILFNEQRIFSFKLTANGGEPLRTAANHCERRIDIFHRSQRFAVVRL